MSSSNSDDLDGLSDEEWAEIVAYGRELADKAGYAWGSKGIPGKDKWREELDAATDVLKFLCLEHSDPVPEPNGNSKPPDVGVILTDGRHIGIEVKEFVCQEMRQLFAQRRKVERKLSLDQLEAYRAEIKGRNPTPDHVSRSAAADWNPSTVATKIDAIVSQVEAQLDGFTDGFSEIWLAITTNEIMIWPEVVMAARDQLTNRPKRIRRVFVRFDYDPAKSDEDYSHYPVVEITRGDL